MIKTILVDDQKNCIVDLRRMLELYHGDIEVVAVCYSVKELENALHNYNPDLVFLDVELDKAQTSFNLLENISPLNFEIIFTTSYNKYALQAIRLSALDYLLKPIEEEELKSALEKFKHKKSLLSD